MKNLKRATTALLAVVVLASGLACANAELNAYRVIGSTSVGIDFAMNAWGEWVRAHEGRPDAVTPVTEAKVKAAYEKYQGGMRVLRAAVITYKRAKEQGVADPALLQAAIQGATDFAYELLNLINSFRTGTQPLTLSDFEIREARALLYGGGQ